jgi:thiol-disulfide isomerase/thioredoxin
MVDFWAYSCINCQRSIPHINAWNEAYGDLGFEVIGVHAPEYAFEKEPRNVKAGAADFGITYPVALDNKLSTWTNYRNRYWPAHYLVDAEGTVRHIKLGEGDYAVTERLIRELLVAANPDVELPPATDVVDETPDIGDTTPETYLGTTKQVNFAGSEKYSAATKEFAAPEKVKKNSFALDGAWTLGTQSIASTGDSAEIELNYTAREVRMVLGGSGTVTYTVDGKRKSIEVSGTPQSYQLLSTDDLASGTVNVKVGAGVDAFSFTFG